jgi:glycyl-tRNA synthetase beta chain
MKIPREIALKAKRAAQFCKADLTTGMVGEFPELQGVMGRYYAIHDNEDRDVANAIAEHWGPLGPSDACPKAPVSVAVALADKIDSLVGFFGVGEAPTGSRDPFALRRAALGVVRLIVENKLRIALGEVFEKAEFGYAESKSGINWTASTRELLAFFADRLKVQFREKGVRHDLIDAVFALGGEDDLVRLLARVEALRSFIESDDGRNLLVAYRRAANIVKIEAKKDKLEKFGAPDPARYTQAEEKELAGALDTVATESGALIAKEDFAGAMRLLAGLRQPVDAFFDKVTVNAPEKEPRLNRLALLQRLAATMDKIADFSRIEG